jgi:hypothetical protein
MYLSESKMLPFKQLFMFFKCTVPLDLNETGTAKSGSILIYQVTGQSINTRLDAVIDLNGIICKYNARLNHVSQLKVSVFCSSQKNK